MRLLPALLAAGAFTLPAAGATGPTIPNCYSQATAPSELTVACADANLELRGLRWQDWGAAEAMANGKARANDCTPYCAAGTFRSYPVTVTASDLRTCPSGRRQYTHLAWSTQAKPPPGQANPSGELTLPCSWPLHPGLTARQVGGKTLLSGAAWMGGASCPGRVTLSTRGTPIATVGLGAEGAFAYAWRAPAGRHLVVASEHCGGTVLYEAVVSVG